MASASAFRAVLCEEESGVVRAAGRALLPVQVRQLVDVPGYWQVPQSAAGQVIISNGQIFKLDHTCFPL